MGRHPDPAVKIGCSNEVAAKLCGGGCVVVTVPAAMTPALAEGAEVAR